MGVWTYTSVVQQMVSHVDVVTYQFLNGFGDSLKRGRFGRLGYLDLLGGFDVE